jgi:hypothetical protein
MSNKGFKITKGSLFVRRRDKVLVVVDKYSGQGVEYHTKPELIVHKVSLDGFRRGFRPATEKEIENEKPRARTDAVLEPNNQ